jgi:hypothetical protein
MFTVTSEAFHEKLNVGDEEIILNGPPGDMRGHMLISNNNDDSLRLKTLPLIQDNKKAMPMGVGAALRISCRLKPGEKRMENISHSLSPQTSPGIYESTLLAGGQKRKVKMIVQSYINIDIYPSTFTFQDTTPGKIHTASFTLANLGNVTFEVPDVKHVAALDMDLLCRAFGFGFRSKGAEGYMPVLDEITKNIQSTLPDWAAAKLEEIGKQVAPGESIMIHMNITMPRNADPRKDYEGSVRFWDKDISFVIKSHNEKK